MQIETYCGREVRHVETHGVMEIYSILSYRSMGCPKYVIFNKRGQARGLARTKRAAISWAKENPKGY